MGANKLINDASELLHRGEIDLAHDALSFVDTESLEPHQARHLGHMKAKIALQQGDLLLAQQILTETLQQRGAHLELLCDLAVSLYYQKDWAPLKIHVVRIEQEIKDAQKLVSLESLAATIELLSKLYEELGELERAFSVTEEIETAKVKPRVRGSLLAQKLRLATLTQDKERIEEIHAELLKFSCQYQKNHFAEIQHSLMWAEAELFGLEKAMLRFQGAMESEQEIDRNLYSYDLLSIALKKSWKFRLRLPEPNGIFESSLKDIFEGIENLDQIMNMSHDMTPGQFFRLLSLCKADPRAARMLSVVISGLSGPSRKLWSRDIVQEQQEQIEMTLQGDLLQFNGTRLDLTNKNSHHALLKAFVEKTVVHVEELAKALGSEFYDLTQYDRVRIAVQRLNQDFLKLTGHKLLILDEGQFELNSVFKLQEV